MDYEKIMTEQKRQYERIANETNAEVQVSFWLLVTAS
jgi:hypothetical protein